MPKFIKGVEFRDEIKQTKHAASERTCRVSGIDPVNSDGVQMILSVDTLKG
jgi:hypothetical protein